MVAKPCSDDCTKVQFLTYCGNTDQVNKQLIDKLLEAEVFDTSIHQDYRLQK